MQGNAATSSQQEYYDSEEEWDFQASATIEESEEFVSESEDECALASATVETQCSSHEEQLQKELRAPEEEEVEGKKKERMDELEPTTYE